jgi:Zn-dependent alcohol dehydrogenase
MRSICEMKAVVFHKRKDMRVDSVEDPSLEDHHSGQALVQRYIDELISWLEEDRIRLDDIITHRLALSEAPHGYEIFNDKKEDCVKVVLKP